MRGLYCRKCNTERHVPRYEADGFYVCENCGEALGYLCKGCDRVYLNNRLGLKGNVYVCKECGITQWGYTDWKRNIK